MKLHFSVGMVMASSVPLTAQSASVGVATDARAILQAALQTESRWVRVHAAEVLLAAGEKTAVTAVFAKEEGQRCAEPGYRIGIWRVLAVARTAERAAWREKIADVFLDKTAPDRLFALESLAKLGDPLTPTLAETVENWRASAPESERTFADWLAWQAGDPQAIVRLAAGLRSSDPLARLRSAYVLRRVRCTDAGALAALTATAAAEPDGTVSRPFVIGAAYALNANAGRAEEWRLALEEIVAHGNPGEVYEALQAFQAHGDEKLIVRLAPLLRHAEGDVRVAAAWTILVVAGKIPR